MLHCEPKSVVDRGRKATASESLEAEDHCTKSCCLSLVLGLWVRAASGPDVVDIAILVINRRTERHVDRARQQDLGFNPIPRSTVTRCSRDQPDQCHTSVA